MQKRSSNKKDINEKAFSILQRVTGQADEKNEAAVALGRLGGLKGGKARAKALTKKQRSEIARLAAIARWKKAD
ncbi:MAG TPA: hypothetical protein VIS99_14485 [Terrimicrobiaceae bacterium]